MWDRIKKYLSGITSKQYEKEIEDEEDYIGVGAMCDTSRINKLEKELDNNE